MTPNIFVIIVTYKGMRWYDKCFSSLRESTLPVHTIVVDNTPGEEEANYIREHYPEIHLIKTEENLGFGKANNLGIRYALDHGCDYVFLLNQDTWLIEKNIFDELVKLSINNPQYGILSPIHVKADEKTISMVLENATNKTSMSLFTDLYKNALLDIYETNYINAAAWLIPRKTLEVVGGFDPIYQHYGEDDDYINRVIYHKLKIGLYTKYRIVHDYHTTENPFEKSINSYRHYQKLLVELTDINQRNTINRYLRYYLRKYLFALLQWKRKEMVHWRKEMVFVLNHKKEIKKSREQNKKNEASWL